ncbi:MAG: right-handed parallel beta-helix repeat-containing protein [Kiritimatiellales bacterium]
MSEHPVAFMSYVRSDDQHENGRLTQFCERLAGEVRMQTGENFHIFQDRNDIAWGQQWKQRIKESLDAVTFLIPIVTPGFFKSPACRDEFEQFLEREKQLGRNDLILPVYYVECPMLSSEEKREKDQLAKIIAERQRVDWRELRFEPFTAPVVGKTFAKMAKQIVTVLDREHCSSPTFSKTPAPVKRSSSYHPMSIETSGESVKFVRSLVSKNEPPTHVVDAFHRGDYATLTAALTAAAPGDRILVRPGLYRESIVINKPVEIIGDGDFGEMVIESERGSTMLFQANMGRVVNLTFRQLGRGDWYCVDIAQGRLDLERCDISSQSPVCVAIHGRADPRLRHNRIHDGEGIGVFVFENGQGTMEDNDIFNSALSGVMIGGDGNLTLRRNRIYNGKRSGILVYENGHATLEDNDIFDNARDGLAVKYGGNITLLRNRIAKNGHYAVWIYEGGRGVIENNDLRGNTNGAWNISSDCVDKVKRLGNQE